MEDYLIHYGVLGMKWGIRRYQNKDGSLTSSGKKRYSGQSDQINRVKERSSRFAKAIKLGTNTTEAILKINKNKYAKKTSRSLKSMSDDDLMKANKRDALETQYKKNRGLENKFSKSSRFDKVNDTMRMVSDAMNKVQKKYEKISESDTAKKAKKMSDDDLRKAVNRMNLERQYRDLSKADRESGANYVYDRRRETIDDIITITSPIVSTIIAPIIIAKILK